MLHVGLLQPEELDRPSPDLVPEPDRVGVEEPLVGLADGERALHPGVEGSRHDGGFVVTNSSQALHEPGESAGHVGVRASTFFRARRRSARALSAAGRGRRDEPVVVRHVGNLRWPRDVGSRRPRPCCSSASPAGSAPASPRCPRCWPRKGAVIIDADAITRELQQPGTRGVRRDGGPVRARDRRRGRRAGPPGGGRHRVQRPRRARRTSTRSSTRPWGSRSPDASRPSVDTDHLVVLDVPLLVESGRDDMAALVVVDVDPEVAVSRLVEQRGMRRGRRAGADGQPGLPRGPAGQGRPRDRQLGHARRPRPPRSTSCGRGCWRSGPAPSVRPTGPASTRTAARRRRTEVDALPLFSVLWALAAHLAPARQPAHGVAAWPRSARGRRGRGPLAARAVGPLAVLALGGRRHACGRRRPCSGNHWLLAALVDLALLLAVAVGRGPAPLGRRHSTWRTGSSRSPGCACSASTSSRRSPSSTPRSSTGR